MKLRLSATTLEAYRRWLENEEAGVADMLTYLDKTIEPTEVMRAGSAFHKILENANNVELSQVELDGFTFDFSEIESEIRLPAIREFKFTRQTEIDGVQVTFVGVVDAMDSTAVYDHKLTSNANAEFYENSMQWRCYLAWLGLPKFTYNLFEKAYQPVSESNLIKLKAVQQITFCRYIGMEDEIRELSASFIAFLKKHAPQHLN